MTALARAGWRTLSLDEFTTGRRAHGAAPTFLLTFDDGYASLADHAFPVLADLGFTATTFVVTDYVGKTNDWDVRYTWNRLAHLDWAAIERWKARGFDFASHGASHRRLTWLSDGAAADELGRARSTLQARLGRSEAVAYPFGAVDGRVIRLARQAGYTLGFGGVRGNGDPLHVPRTPVYFWDFGAMPLGLRTDWLGGVGRFVAHVANRCAVGTSIIQRIGRRRESAAGA